LTAAIGTGDPNVSAPRRQTGSARLGVVGMPVGARMQVPSGGTVRRKGVHKRMVRWACSRLTTMGL
jgi:hypothetical protein